MRSFDEETDDPEAGYDSEVPVVCPWCGAETLIAIDLGGGDEQEYVEDCAVCCRPWRLVVRLDEVGGPQVEVSIDQ